MSLSNVSNTPETQNATVKLTVQTGDEATEIFVLDSQFQRVARSVGDEVEFQLPRGLYSIKVRTGVESKEQPILLSKDDRISFTPLEFASPAPLESTTKTHEFHTGNADYQSRIVHVSHGLGSQIYVFARDWTSKEPSPISPTPLHPARGLTLRSHQNEVLVDFAMPSWPTNMDPTLIGDPWMACNTEVNPGIYRLCLQLASGEVLEQTIVASSGWQTQVFLLQREYGFKESDRRADLMNASIFMSRSGSGFHAKKLSYKSPDEVDFRLTEMARQGLANGRQVLPKDIVRRMLDAKFSNPMLGIFGAHLMLLGEEPDRDMARHVVANLRALLGSSHPDVEAIVLKLGQSSDYVFDAPPMLHRSWTYVIQESVRQTNLVPQSSLAYQACDRLLSGNPWLLWVQAEKKTDIGAVYQQLRGLIRQIILRTPDNSGNLDYRFKKFLMSFSEEDDKTVDSNAQETFQKLDEDKIVELIQTFGVPRNKLEDWIKTSS